MSSARNDSAIFPSYQEAFRLRMKNQCREIERYRLAQNRHSGRDLSMDEAAVEWIERFAADFARNYTISLD